LICFPFFDFGLIVPELPVGCIPSHFDFFFSKKITNVAFFCFISETQPQLMLTGPIGFNNSTSAPPGGAPYAGAAGNSFPQGGGMPYQGYSM